ncbi:hypothetical protein CRE_21148 [Caenorhabditis remanei]|uniref:Uncharacterized protein n=1 Tax=Caenorhabditis remanei TaxID=31234 RepID=E3MEZ9_CAERE|nr:hypothetical protein CRE_21148 [Caenorhabditis remanei]
MDPASLFESLHIPQRPPRVINELGTETYPIVRQYTRACSYVANDRTAPTPIFTVVLRHPHGREVPRLGFWRRVWRKNI